MKNRDELNRLWLAAAQEPLGAQLCGRRVPLGRKTNAAPEIATKISHIQRNTKEKMVSTTQDPKINFFIDNQMRLQIIHKGHHSPSLI
jgi:hypothetical protein